MARSTLEGYHDEKPSLLPSLDLSHVGRSKSLANHVDDGTASRSFNGGVEARTPPPYAVFPDSCCHQFLTIAGLAPPPAFGPTVESVVEIYILQGAAKSPHLALSIKR
jgi:hypothetical protein